MSNNHRWNQHKGFTLIELLVVISIILVLISIALPNYLDALVRCRVACVKADMRTLATSLDQYRSNYRTYPPVGGSFGDSFLERLLPLTTPVRFLQRLPHDPLPREEGTYGSTLEQDPFPGDQYLYNTGAATYGTGVNDPRSGLHDRYSLHSAGPDGKIDFPYYAFSINFILNQRHLIFIYSPTNGTRSTGDIIRRGGEIPNPQPGFGS